MQYHIQTLVKHLFDKDSFEQVTVQELKQFTEAYPYAAVGQFLYAKKLYDARSWNYYEQTEQANLYFHNPLWFRWLMDQKYVAPVLQQQEPFAGNNTAAVAATAEPETQLHQYLPGINAEEPIQADTEEFGFVQTPGAPAEDYTEEVTDNTGQEETATTIETTTGIPAAGEETETSPEFFAEADRQQDTPVHEEMDSPATVTGNSLLTAEHTVETGEPDQTIPASGEPSAPEIADASAATEATAATETTETPATHDTPAITETSAIAEPEIAPAIHEASATTALPAAPEAPAENYAEAEADATAGEPPAEQPATTESLADIHMAASGFTSQPETPEEKTEAPAAAPAGNDPEMPEPIPKEPVFNIPVTREPSDQQWKAEPVFTPVSKEPKTTIDTEEPIFESYHTIDYFASQGIKLQQEEYKDRLGKQLKSFTEWLRSMKRIVPTEASASLDEVTNQSIQRIAEHSVKEKEVITEAMAEVWAKQGHPEKAISVYEKLSLLNPAKSHYFAGRIEQLKAL